MTKRKKYWEFYYAYQYMLSQDRWYLETIIYADAGVGNGVRKESSLPFALLRRARQLAEIELMNEEDEIQISDALCQWKLYNKSNHIQELRCRMK